MEVQNKNTNLIALVCTDLKVELCVLFTVVPRNMYFLWFCHGAVDSSVSSPNASDTKFPISTMYNPFLGASIWLPSMTWRRRMLDRLLPQLSHKQDRIRPRRVHPCGDSTAMLRYPSSSRHHPKRGVSSIRSTFARGCCCGECTSSNDVLFAVGCAEDVFWLLCLLSVLLVAFVWGGGEGRGGCGSALKFRFSFHHFGFFFAALSHAEFFFTSLPFVSFVS